MTTPLSKAEAAYNQATQAQTVEAWEQAAVLLFKVRRKPRKASSRSKGRYPAPVAVTTFSDGRLVTMSFFSPKGKPLDWERAARVCISAYRMLHGTPHTKKYGEHSLDAAARRMRERLPLNCVPAIVQIYEKTTGETWTPERQTEQAA